MCQVRFIVYLRYNNDLNRSSRLKAAANLEHLHSMKADRDKGTTTHLASFSDSSDVRVEVR